ncbi:MAG TPA: Fur family transcriptional regulator [Solirubrobacterales bacterium]|jgi:Fur family ferric uptake transcriptional regulator
MRRTGPADRGSTIGPIAGRADKEWVNDALATLQHAGYQKGGARRSVIEALAHHHCAVTALELEDDLRSRNLTVARASIYRALDQLVELRLVHRVDVGRERASYERAERSGEHHHHMVCDHCGRVTPFEDGSLERAIRRVSEGATFEVKEHEIVLRGLCPRCS